MPKLNKKLIDRGILLQVENELFKALAQKSKREVEGILRTLMTEVELDMMAKRIAIIKLLTEKLPQKQIAERLGVSNSTVSQLSAKIRSSRPLQRLSKDFQEDVHS